MILYYFLENIRHSKRKKGLHIRQHSWRYKITEVHEIGKRKNIPFPVPQTFDFVTVMGQNYSAVQGTHPNCNAGPILRGCCSLFPWGDGEQSNVCMSQKCKQKGSEYSEIKSLSTNLQWIQLWQLMLLLRLSPLSLCQNRWQEGNIAMSHQLQMMPRRLD